MLGTQDAGSDDDSQVRNQVFRPRGVAWESHPPVVLVVVVMDRTRALSVKYALITCYSAASTLISTLIESPFSKPPKFIHAVIFPFFQSITPDIQQTNCLRWSGERRPCSLQFSTLDTHDPSFSSYCMFNLFACYRLKENSSVASTLISAHVLCRVRCLTVLTPRSF